MKLSIALASATLVAGLPNLFFNHHGHHQQIDQQDYNNYNDNNNYNDYNGYNGAVNVPNYQTVNTEAGHDDGLFTTNRDCLNNDQLRLFGIKFDFLPGVAYNQGIDLNRGCGSLFNVHAINDAISKGGDMIGKFINPFSLFKRDSESTRV